MTGSATPGGATVRRAGRVSLPPVGAARGRIIVLSRDAAATEDGTWQSGRLEAPDGRAWRFVARGLPFLPVGAEAEVRYHVEPIPVEARSPYAPAETQQLALDECARVHLPTTPNGVARFVAGNVAGVGPKRAGEIARRLGGNAVERLNSDPALLETLFPGKVGRDLAFAWTRWRDGTWRSHERACDLALRLASRGVAYRHARRIMQFFRSADVAEVVLLRRPYRLLDVPGFGWKRADRVAQQLGMAPDAPERLAAAAAAALAEAAAEDGHSCVPAPELARRAAARAGGVALAARGLSAAVAAGTMVDDNGWCYLPAALEAEWTVARHVRRRLEVAYDVPAMARSEVAAEIAAARLSLVQAGAVWDALTRGVFVLTGGPGTGKTTTVRTVVRCAQAMGLRLKVVAPTGKAVARATAVTGAPAETVHRLIGGAPGSTRRAPLDLDLVIVDETSMASVEVMAWLLANLRPEARVVLVGDPDQLPSVDHGAVLRDLLTAARVPSVRLTEVYRQRRTSGIVQNAYRVLSGAALAPTPDFRVSDVTDRRGAIADEAWEKQAARQALVHELARLSAAGVDVTADVQVLTPMKKATNLLGAHALNALLQDALNPNGAVGPEVAGGRRVRVGDRVMQVRNDYALGDTGVFNGEMGEVTAVGPDAVTVRFGDARNLTVRGYRLYNLQLAWATTIHRSQGSEWPVVVVVAHRTHGAMLTRELLYTAVTRAAREVVVIADDGALARVRGDTTPGPGRHTGLARHLAR